MTFVRSFKVRAEPMEGVISTLPPGVSRWLLLDLRARVSRRYPRILVIHVVAQAAARQRPLPSVAGGGGVDARLAGLSR